MVVFIVIVVGVLVIMFLYFVRLLVMFFGVGCYMVMMELVEVGGLYCIGNVIYCGFEVGWVVVVWFIDIGV